MEGINSEQMNDFITAIFQKHNSENKVEYVKKKKANKLRSRKSERKQDTGNT